MHIFALQTPVFTSTLFAITLFAFCDLNATQLYSPEIIMQCFGTLEMNQSIFNQHRHFVEQLTEHYVFADNQLSNLADHPLNLTFELIKIHSKYENSATFPAFKYYEEIHDLLRTIGDTHFKFFKPSFFKLFSQVSPLQLEMLENGSFILVKSTVLGQIVENYEIQFGSLSPFVNKTIKSMNKMTPDTFLQNFGDAHAHQRFRNQRVAQSLLLDFISQNYYQTNFGTSQIEIEFDSGESLTLNRYVAVAIDLNDETAQLYYNLTFRSNPFQKGGANEDQSFPNEVNILNMSNAPQPPASFKLLVEVKNNFYFYQHLSGDYYFLIVSSTVPQPASASLEKLLAAFQVVKASPKFSRLFINLINPGGNPDFSTAFALAVQPEMYPLFPRAQFRHSRLMDLLNRVTVAVNQYDLFDWVTGAAKHRFDYADDSEENVKVLRENIGGLSDVFSFNILRSFNTTDGFEKFLRFGGIGKDPNQIVVINDGICASAAGFLANFLKMNRYGIHVTFYKKFEQLCAVPGGLFMGYQVYFNSIRSILKDKSVKYNKTELDYLKSIWPPTDADLWVTSYKTFSPGLHEQEALQNIPVDFRQDVTADIVFKQFPTLTEINNGLFIQVEKMITQNLFDPSQFFGPVCRVDNNKVFRLQNNKCQQFGCAVGYRKLTTYESFDCVRRTDVWQRQIVVVNSVQQTGFIICVSIISFLLAVAVGFNIILVLKLKKIKDRDSEYTKGLLTDQE